MARIEEAPLSCCRGVCEALPFFGSVSGSCRENPLQVEDHFSADLRAPTSTGVPLILVGLASTNVAGCIAPTFSAFVTDCYTLVDSIL